MSKTRQTTKGLYGFPIFSGLVYRFTTSLIRVLMRFYWRGNLKGMEKLPKEEPFLLLPNHTSMMDPFWVGGTVPRGVRAMASAGLLRIPVLGAYLKMCGCFAKMKYTKDRESMQALQRHYDDGYAVLLFPEGNRSWNGEIEPIGEGIGRLIKRLNCKVVYARLNTAYLVKPRWATYSRRIPIDIDYDGPYSYDETQSVADITADVQKRLTVVPPTSYPKKVSGKKLAHGLEKYLWACPSCFAVESLTPGTWSRSEADREGSGQSRTDKIACSDCGESWGLDLFCMLHPKEGEVFSVADAFRKIDAHFGSPPVADQAHFQATGEALVVEDAELSLIPRKGKPNRIVKGRLSLNKEGLQINPASGDSWTIGWGEMRGVSVEVGNKLHFRQEDRLYRVESTGHSPLKLDHFFRHWALKAKNS